MANKHEKTRLMAKRMTDTNKWRKPFIRGLDASYKLFWFYILDDCDHAGIWIVDMEVANIRVGEEINQNKAIELFGDKIIVFDGGEKWFIPDFIEFQYGELSESNRAHNSAIQLLRKYGLINNKGLIRGLYDPKDKEKDKDKDKDTVRGKCLFKNSGVTIDDITDAFVKTEDLKKADPRHYFNAVKDWSDSKGEHKIDWIATARSFARKDLKDNKLCVNSSGSMIKNDLQL